MYMFYVLHVLASLQSISTLMGEPMQVDEVGSSSEQRPHLTAHHKLRERLRIAHLSGTNGCCFVYLEHRERQQRDALNRSPPFRLPPFQERIHRQQ